MFFVFCFFKCKSSFLYQRPPLQSFKCNDKWNTLNFKYVNLKRAEVDRITVFFCYVKSIFCVISNLKLTLNSILL